MSADTGWVAKPAPHAQGGTWGVKDKDGNWVAICHPGNGDKAGRLVAMGRARRIAALPALMEAAERAVAERCSCDGSAKECRRCGRLRAALALAGGEL